MAYLAQGKELLDGINTIAAIILDAHFKTSSTHIADQLTEHVAERLNEEIKSQMSTLEKQLEEKTSVVLSMVNQAYDKIRKATEKLEGSMHAIQQATRHNETSTLPHVPHAPHSTDPPSYASVIHSHLPTSHLSNIARQRAQKCRILLDSSDDTAHHIKDLSEAQIVAKANLALEQMADKAPPAGKFTGARILRNGGVVIEASSEDLTEWVQYNLRRDIFLNKFDGGQTQIKDKLFSVILEFVPIAHKLGNQPKYRHIEGVSHIDEGHLESTKWMKPVERPTEGQRTAHVLAKFRSPRAANQVI